MFTTFLIEENILSEVSFSNYQVPFNLFYTIIEGKDPIALKAMEANAIALQNPGKPMWLWINETLKQSSIDNIINSLCNQLKESKLCGISGKPEFVKIFAEEYSKMLGISYGVSLSMEAYHCTKVINPDYVQGKLIVANLTHKDIVAGFCVGFVFWCFGATISIESQVESSETMINSGNLFLWEVNGEICAMINIAHRSEQYARINDVYTSPEQRGNGYASKMVGELSSMLIKEGLIPMLYADTKNATSNHVYKSIGFKKSGRIDDIVFNY
ncbi:MAG TPA: GNAT family N-acetyltransferase [Clostridiaceae bacterium]